jgi:hypothetical protein
MACTGCRLIVFQDELLFRDIELRYGTTVKQYEYIHLEFLCGERMARELGCETLDEHLICSIIASAAVPFSEAIGMDPAALPISVDKVSAYRLVQKCKSARFLRLMTGAWSSLAECDERYLPSAYDSAHMPAGLTLAVLDKAFYNTITDSSYEAELFLTRVLQLQRRVHDIDIIDEITARSTGLSDFV